MKVSFDVSEQLEQEIEEFFEVAMKGTQMEGVEGFSRMVDVMMPLAVKLATEVVAARAAQPVLQAIADAAAVQAQANELLGKVAPSDQ